MDWGFLSDKQSEAVKKFVRGREVWDLGAGDGGFSEFLSRSGCKRVVAVDKEPLRTIPGVENRREYFAEITDPIDVAFVSWPQNKIDYGLLNMFERAKDIIYLGRNTDWSATGFEALFNEMRKRELLYSLPERRNTLQVVGPKRVKRNPTEEEWVATQMYEKMYTFEEMMEGHARKFSSA